MAVAAALLCVSAVWGLARAELAPPLRGSWPWRQWCRQPYLDDNYTGCIVDRRADLPRIRPGATFEVVAAEHYLSAGGRIADMLWLTHMGLWLREAPGPLSENVSFVLEYAAIKFGAKAFFPDIQPGGELLWDNRASVAWYPEANKTSWLAESELTRAGFVNSSTLERWFDWMMGWSKERLGYNLWSVWDRQDVVGARRLLPDSICHTFVEDGLAEMYRLGAPLDQEEAICRNYFPLIDTVALRTVDINDNEVRQDVVSFYTAFKDLVDKPFRNITAFGRALVSLIRGLRNGPHFYIYQMTSREAGPKYWLANLSRPYFGLHTSQRMLLPWQDTSHVSRRECRRKRAVTLPVAPATTASLEQIFV